MHLELLKVVIKLYLQQTLTIYSTYKGVCVHFMNIYATQKSNVFIYLYIYFFFLLSGKCCL